MKMLMYAVLIGSTLIISSVASAQKKDWKWSKYGIEKTDNPDAIPTAYKKGTWQDKSLDRIKVTPLHKWGIKTIMLGDSITAGWRWSSKAKHAPKILLALSISIKTGLIYSIAINGAETKNVLWQITEGNVIDKRIKPQVFTLMVGVNNIIRRKSDESIKHTANGIKTIIKVLKKQYPKAKILLFAVLPHFGKAYTARAVKLNKLIEKFVDFKTVYYLDMSEKFLKTKGLLYDGIYPNDTGYQVWADTMKPYLEDLLKNNGGGEIWQPLKEKYLGKTEQAKEDKK